MTKRDGLTIMNLHVSYEAEYTRMLMFVLFFMASVEMDFSTVVKIIACIISLLQVVTIIVTKVELEYFIRRINSEDGIAEND